MHKRAWIVALLVVVDLLPAMAAGKTRVAILDLTAKGGVTQDDADLFSELVRVGFSNTGTYTVVARNELKKIFGERKLYELDMKDVSAMTSSADLALIGNIYKRGEGYVVTASIYDIATADVLVADQIQASTDAFLAPGLGQAADLLVKKLAARITEGKAYKQSTQFEHPYRGVGWTLLAVGVAALAGGGVMVGLAQSGSSDAEDKLSAYRKATADFDKRWSAYETAYDDAGKLRWGGIACLGVGAVAAGTGLLLLLHEQPVEQQVALAPLPLDHGAGLLLAARW